MPTLPVATFEFHPSLLIQEEYSDNFFLTPGGGQENFRTTLGPGFSMLMNSAKTQGSLSTSLNFAFDTLKTGQQQHFFPNLGASIRHTLEPRLNLTLTDSLASGDNSEQSDQFGIRSRERRQFITNSFGLSADWVIDTITTQAYYRQSAFAGSNTAGTSQNLSNQEFSHVFGANASVPVATDNTLRLGYEFSLTQGSGPGGADSTGHLGLASFTRQLNPYTSAGISTSYSIQSLNNSRVWNISLFTTYALPTGLSVSSSLGYSLLSADNTPNTSAVSTNTNISYQFARAVASLGVSQDYRQTFIQGENFGIVLTRTVTASLTFPVTAATQAVVTASYSENEPTGSGNNRQNPTTKALSGTATLTSRFFTTGARASRGDNQIIGPINSPTGFSGETVSVGGFVYVPLGRWFSVNLDYNHFREAGAAGVPDTVENRATVSLQGRY